MDFKEWLRKHEREVFKNNQGCFDTAYKFGAKQGYEAGQQSKQAEIDALKNLIDEIVGIVREADLSDGDSSVAIVHDKVQEMLK